MNTAQMSENELRSKKQLERAKIFLLYMGIGSMTMTFAGLTSAFIVQEGQRNWYNFTMPQIFWFSTIALLVSSVLMNMAYNAAKNNQSKKAGNLLLGVLGLGLLFTVLQVLGWKELVEGGLYFSDKKNISGSFFYTLTGLHVVHLLAGLITILVTAINAFRNKYSSEEYLGIKLTSYFWHYLDLLWLYLFIFLIIKNA